MFASVKARFQDTKTIARLCTEAEQCARAAGRVKPGSEHFVLAALRLPEPSAAQAFNRLGLDAETFSQAIAAQFSQALEAVGVLVTPSAQAGSGSAARVAPAPALYEAEASGQALLQRLAESRKLREARGLLGADVLLASAQEEHSIASRAFASLGISKQRLTEAAVDAVAATRQAASEA
ncbi:MAG: peptidase [Paucibacter sp.]|nr:peptidase [Roseateles sp.]